MSRKARNFVIVCAVFATIMLTFGTSAFSASYKSLYGSLKDLPGWKGEKPKGTQANIGGMKMVTASPKYHQKGKMVNVAIISGLQAKGMIRQQVAKQKEMTMDTPKGKIMIKKINGVYVQMVFEKARKEGTILVPLNNGKQKVPAIFAFHFKGLSLEKGRALAESFDWKNIRKKLQAFQ